MLESQYATVFNAIALTVDTLNFLPGKQTQHEGAWVTFGVLCHS